MKTRYTMTLAIIASFGLGTLAAKALHAQATRPAYVVTIFDTEDIMNTNYPSLDPATFEPFGGRYIVHFGRTVTFDGLPPNQLMIIAFDSMWKMRKRGVRRTLLTKCMMLTSLRTFEPLPWRETNNINVRNTRRIKARVG